MRCLIEKLWVRSILILLKRLSIFVALILIIVLIVVLIIIMCWFWLKIISWRLIKWLKIFILWLLLIILSYEIFMKEVSELKKVFMLIELLTVFSYFCENLIFWLSWHCLISWNLCKVIKSVELLLSQYFHELNNSNFRDWFINKLMKNDVKMISCV